MSRRAMEHLLKEPLVPEIGEDGYDFCTTPDCPTVYFPAESSSNGKTLRKSDLKVRVGLKETADPISICYCFGHTRASAWNEIERTGASTVVDSIRREIELGRCECETRNPSGKCCLGDVARVVRKGFERNRLHGRSQRKCVR